MNCGTAELCLHDGSIAEEKRHSHTLIFNFAPLIPPVHFPFESLVGSLQVCTISLAFPLVVTVIHAINCSSPSGPPQPSIRFYRFLRRFRYVARSNFHLPPDLICYLVGMVDPCNTICQDIKEGRRQVRPYNKFSGIWRSGGSLLTNGHA